MWPLLFLCAVLLGDGRAASAADERKQTPQAPPTAAPSEPISTSRYVTAGVTGTLLGNGIGHAVAYEWTETGWLFTFGEISLAVYGGLAQGLSQYDADNDAGGEFPTGVLVAIGIVRAIEIVDIWTRPDVRPPSGVASATTRVSTRGGWALVPAPAREGGRVLLIGSF